MSDGTLKYAPEQIEKVLDVFNAIGAAFANLQFAARAEAERVDAAMTAWYASMDDETKALIQEVVKEREAKEDAIRKAEYEASVAEREASNGEG